MAFSTYYTSAVSIDGNNYLRFRFEGERIGNTVTIKNIYLNPKWAVDSLPTGWNFQLKVNGTVKKQETKSNFTAGGYSNEYSDASLLWSGPFSYTVTYSSNAVISIGIPSMYYNGTTVGDKFTSYTFAPVASPNSAPGTPTISCTSGNNYGGIYYGESSISIALSTVSDPDGDAVSYRIYGQYKTPGGSFVNWRGGSDDLVSADRTRTIDISSFERGTQFRFWGYAKDSNDAWSGKSNVIENIYRNKVPSTPKISCTSEKTLNGPIYVSESSITISLSGSSDPEGTSISYKLYGEYYDGGWKTLGSSSDNSFIETTSSKTFSISGYKRGTQFRFWGYAVDALGAWSSKSSVISGIYRNQAPGAPSLTCSNTIVNGKYICESTIGLTLSQVTDPEDDPITYRIYGQYKTPGGSFVNWNGGLDDLVYEGRYATIDLTNFSRGTEFKFWAHARDDSQAISAKSNILENIFKNSVGTVSGIGPTSRVITATTIPLTWNQTVDPDGQSVTYDIFVSKDGGSYTSVASKQSANSYSYSISSDAKGTKYKFKIRAYDGMAYSEEVESPLYRKDFKPELILPNTPCTLYQNNPRIVFSKIKSSDIYTCVSYNNKSYNGKDNSSMFTTSSTDVSGEQAYVFNSTGLNIGSNTITIYNTDGTFNSSSISLTINVENLDKSIVSEIITKALTDTLNSKSNIIRNAYKLDNKTFTTITKGTSLINYSHINDLRVSIDDIRTKINGYDSNKKSQSWNNIAKGNIIKKSDYEQLIDSMKNL